MKLTFFENEAQTLASGSTLAARMRTRREDTDSCASAQTRLSEGSLADSKVSTSTQIVHFIIVGSIALGAAVVFFLLFR